MRGMQKARALRDAVGHAWERSKALGLASRAWEYRAFWARMVGLASLAVVGLGGAIYGPAKKVKIGPNFGPLGPTKRNK